MRLALALGAVGVVTLLTLTQGSPEPRTALASSTCASADVDMTSPEGERDFRAPGGCARPAGSVTLRLLMGRFSFAIEDDAGHVLGGAQAQGTLVGGAGQVRWEGERTVGLPPGALRLLWTSDSPRLDATLHIPG